MSDTIGIDDQAVAKEADGLEERLQSIASSAAKCSVWNPVQTYRRTAGLRQQLGAMRADFEWILGALVAVMNAPTSGPGFLAGSVKTGVVGAAMMRYLRLQQAWTDASASLDRQGAYSLGVLGLYVAILALLLSLLPLVLPLLPSRGQ